jgi:hypothetical protein
MLHFDRRLLQHFDWVMLLMVLLVGGMALTNLYSSTYIADKGRLVNFLQAVDLFCCWSGRGFADYNPGVSAGCQDGVCVLRRGPPAAGVHPAVCETYPWSPTLD